MNKLVITQDNSRTEYPVPNAVITALYNIGKDDDQNLSLTEGVDTTNNNRPVSTVSGSIRVATAYAHHLLYIAVKYPNLSITADSTYIYFADPEVERVLLAAGIGDGVGVSISAAANATVGTALRGNTAITSFNEFGYFSKANNSPANEMFKGCTNLESIDLSNTTSISTYQFSLTAITDINAPDLVSYIGYNLFAQCTQLKTVSSLGHISTIPNSCFFGSYNLETVNLPDECVSIELSSFFPGDNNSGSLTEVNGIDHVLSFGFRALCRLSNLHLYSRDLYNATSIGDRAFWYVKIHSIDCPNLASLGSSAFRENPVLTNVDCLGKISSIPSDCFRQDTALQTVKLPYECTNITSNAFDGCSILTSITQYNKSIDDYFEGETPTFTNISKITNIGLNAFHNCSNLAITINLPNLTSLGLYAFLNTGITSITDLGSISTIPKSCFNNCNSLTTVTLPNTCNSISNLAFALSSALTTINLGNITSIDDYAFGVCTNLTGNYVLPNLNSIGTGAFNQSGVISVDFTGSTIVSISNECFKACKALTSITLPSTCTNIGSSAFRDATSLTTINLDNIVSIGSSYTFGSTKIANFMLPNIQTIADSAFRWCKYSQLIDMGPNLSSIGDRAFYESTFTVFIFRGATVPAYNANTYPTFLSNMSGVTIYVPESALNDYKTAWPAMASNIVKIEGSAYDT